MKKSAFLSWFEAQHGPRTTRTDSDDTLELIMVAGNMAQCEIAKRRTYDARLQSALYAWTAKDKPEAEILKLIKK